MSDPARPILAVEDNDEDFFALVEALKSAGARNPVDRCSSLAAARAALLSPDGGPRARSAALILLDLNLPGVHGCELLEDFRRTDPVTPVLILSTSAHPGDVERCYRAGANAYLVKPLEFANWERLFDSVYRFWLRDSQLPTAGCA